MRSNLGQKRVMSAYRAATETCFACGAELPAAAQFCPECGLPATPDPQGTVPVSNDRPEPRFFGVTPPLSLLGVVVATLVVAVVLFATGHWPYGLIVLGVAALLVAALVDIAGRRPDLPATRAAQDARERTRSAFETWRTRVAVTAEARRIQHGLARVDADRQSALLELGVAVHRGDEVGEGGARARLADLDREESVLHDELSRSLEQAGERIRQAQFPVQETIMVTPSEPYPPPGEATPPEPAIVPEPYPPPGEATPPEPAIVPEEYPPPDEGTPPTPEPDPGRDA